MKKQLKSKGNKKVNFFLLSSNLNCLLTTFVGGQFFFRVKFYVSDPSKLQEEYTRYQFYLQIRKDILQGRLQLPPSTACLIASYTVQCEYHSGFIEKYSVIKFIFVFHIS